MQDKKSDWQEVASFPFRAPMKRPIKLVCLVSGGGTTMTNLQAKIDAGQLSAEIVGCIASNDHCKGIQRAQDASIPVQVISRKSHSSTEAFSDVIYSQIEAWGADLVCLCGFLSLLQIRDDYMFRVLNIHPGLLPSFGGSGMHGSHVHQAVIDKGAKLSGCTVHFADNTYDTGPILVQRSCAVLADDDASQLAARVFEQEQLAYPEAVSAIAQGRVVVERDASQAEASVYRARVAD